MAAVTGTVDFFGKINISLDDTTTLANADVIFTEELADEIKTKVNTITGVSSSEVTCFNLIL